MSKLLKLPIDNLQTDQELWKILIADDDPEIHKLTHLVLKDFEFAHKKLLLMSAYSEKEAIEILQKHSDIALVLLDLVMESSNSGLNVIKILREELGNKKIRIVLRTANALQIPENELIAQYDINDYKDKKELTSQKLITSIYAALRSYNDLLELEHSRELLMQSERMTLVSGLATGMAHEIRNPLTAILGNIENAKISIQQNPQADISKFLANIRQAVAMIVDIIDKMLAYTRVSQFSLEQHNILPIINDAIHLLSSDLELKREYHFTPEIIQIDCPPELPMILCSKIELMQVFVNLIKNAIHALHNQQDPQIIISLSQVANLMQINIRDNGMGIEAENLAKIFRPFFSTKQGQGTGLGLAICLYIIEDLHRGSIEANSQPGQGTEIIIKLPLNN